MTMLACRRLSRSNSFQSNSSIKIGPPVNVFKRNFFDEMESEQQQQQNSTYHYTQAEQNNNDSDDQMIDRDDETLIFPIDDL